MLCPQTHKIYTVNTCKKKDPASKITLYFLLVALLSFMILAVLHKDKRSPNNMAIQSFTHSTVSSKTHLGTKDFEKFWEVLALLFCFRYRGPKART